MKAYRGIGKVINATYGGSDDGIGEFWTDNMTMAMWFAGLIEFNTDTAKYEKVSDNGKIITANIEFKNPFIIDSFEEGFDAFQQYMDEINEFDGVENYKNDLLSESYDGIILRNCNTNYYEDGTYSIYIIL